MSAKRLREADVTANHEDGPAELLCAVRVGDETRVQVLLDQGVDPNVRDTDDNTPLLCAARYGHREVVRLLLERDGVDVNSKNKVGWTALSRAAQCGYEEVVQLLLGQSIINLNSVDGNGATPLHWAATNGREAVVQLLLNQDGIEPDLKEKKYGGTPLHYAALKGHVSVVEQLLERDGVDPEAKDGYERTPFSRAALGGHEMVMRLLLKKGGLNPNSQDYHGLTPLSFAARKGQEAVVRLLLERTDVDPELEDARGWTPLVWATRKGHRAVVQQLLSWDAIGSNSRDQHDGMPLMMRKGYEDGVKLLQKRSPPISSELQSHSERRNFQLDLDPDDLLLNSQKYFSELEDLEASIYGNSAVKFYKRDEVRHIRPIEGGHSVFQIRVPFPKVGQEGWIWYFVKDQDILELCNNLTLSGDALDFEPGNTSMELNGAASAVDARILLLELLECRNVMATVILNLSLLKKYSYCDRTINILVRDLLRSNVVHLVPLRLDRIRMLAWSFETTLRAAKEQFLEIPASAMAFGSECEEFLHSLGLLPAVQHSDKNPMSGPNNLKFLKRVWRDLVHTLEFAVLSYSGAHIERLDERHLNETIDSFSIAAPFLGAESAAITMRRRSLKCLDVFLGGQEVWVFEPHSSSMGENMRFYLPTSVQDIADIWGPLWKSFPVYKPNEIAHYNVGSGFIVAWPPNSEEAQIPLSGEVFCRWISSMEDYPGQPKYFRMMDRLLIGAATFPRLFSNSDCTCTVDYVKKTMRDAGCLREGGTWKTSLSWDSALVQAQVGGMGINVTYGRIYKRRSGQSWKNVLVERWKMEPERRNPKVLENFCGVEVSSCTKNARRRRLVDILFSKTMKNYIAGISVTWEDEDCRLCYETGSTADMPADGLTKILPRQKHENFVRQLGLVDISHLLEENHGH